MKRLERTLLLSRLTFRAGCCALTLAAIASCGDDAKSPADAASGGPDGDASEESNARDDDAGGRERDAGSGEAALDGGASPAEDAARSSTGDAALAAMTDASTGPRARSGLALYPGGSRHSPITEDIAENLRAILTKGSANPRNFIRLGDNLSHASHLLGCFDSASGKDGKLGATAYAKSTLDYFNDGDIAGASPFAHTVELENLAPWTIIEGNAGSSFLQREIASGRPGFALVSFGPIGHAGSGDPNKDDWLIVEQNGGPLLQIADTLIAAGTIPLFRSVAPGYGSSKVGPNMLVPLVNAVARAVAQGRQVPFADAHLDTLSLGAEGFWSDGAHLSAYMDNPCDLSEPAFVAGANRVNRIALQQLHRSKQVAIDRAAAPDADALALEGEGTSSAPYQARALPFVDLRRVGDAGQRTSYSACGGTAQENGGERIYRFEASKRTALRAFVFDRSGSPAQTFVHHFIGDLEHCASTHFALLELEVAAGVHYFVVDGALAAANGTPPEYGFGLVECAAGDPTCVSDSR